MPSDRKTSQSRANSASSSGDLQPKKSQAGPGTPSNDRSCSRRCWRNPLQPHNDTNMRIRDELDQSRIKESVLNGNKRLDSQPQDILAEVLIMTREHLKSAAHELLGSKLHSGIAHLNGAAPVPGPTYTTGFAKSTGGRNAPPDLKYTARCTGSMRLSAWRKHSHCAVQVERSHLIGISRRPLASMMAACIQRHLSSSCSTCTAPAIQCACRDKRP